MKEAIIKTLLVILNSSWLNASPCKYGYINGLEAISYEELKNEVEMNPHKLVRDMIRDIDKMRSCPIEPHTHDSNGIRPINDQDIKDLQNLTK